MFVMLNAILIAGVFPFRESHRGVPYDVMDSLDARSRAYVCLYFFYGFLDGAWQCYAYWIMGCLSNDPLVLSMYAAFYKVFGAAGAAIVFSLDANKKPKAKIYKPAEIDALLQKHGLGKKDEDSEMASA